MSRNIDPKPNSYHCRQYQLKKRYGITMSEYKSMCDEVGGLCEICGTSGADGKNLSVDHDHETGKIRGMLCNRCNMALGGFMDSPRLLSRATRYLLTRGAKSKCESFHRSCSCSSL